MAIFDPFDESWRWPLTIVLFAANVAVWLSAYWEGEQFSEQTKEAGWRLLLRGLAIEPAGDTARANENAAIVLKEAAWRFFDPTQVANALLSAARNLPIRRSLLSHRLVTRKDFEKRPQAEPRAVCRSEVFVLIEALHLALLV